MHGVAAELEELHIAHVLAPGQALPNGEPSPPRRQATEQELLHASFALATAHNRAKPDLDPEAFVDGQQQRTLLLQNGLDGIGGRLLVVLQEA